jgi:5-methylcytosine-specific restriction endonuclease McrA
MQGGDYAKWKSRCIVGSAKRPSRSRDCRQIIRNYALNVQREYYKTMVKRLETAINAQKAISNGIRKEYICSASINERPLVAFIRTGREIAIVNANFCCEKCLSTENLTIHHLISRIAKYYIKDYPKYIIQRNYWANLVILCKECHHSFHHECPIPKDRDANSHTISEKLIIRLKKKYGVIKKEDVKEEKN